MVGKKLKVGVLALQGAFREHTQVLSNLGHNFLEVRLPKDLDCLDALIIPGGESTTIARLAEEFQLIEPLKDFCSERKVWGTCAGLIFLAKNVGTKQTTLQLLDVTVKRNAFGRQSDSFVMDLNLPFISEPENAFPAVFIRAPLIREVGEGVSVLAELAPKRIIIARQKNIFVTAFHPELTGDYRLHQYFLDN